MLDTLNVIVNLHVSSFANRFIYYLQRLPWIGRRIGDEAYSGLGWKRAAAIASSVLVVLWGFLSHMLYVGLLVYLPVVLWGNDLSPDRQASLFWHIFFMLSFVVAGISSARVLEPKRGKYVAVKLMRLPATRYMRVTLGYRYVAFLIQLTPALLLFASLLGASPINGLLAAVAVVLWRVFCEYAHLALYRRTGTVLIKQTALVWLVVFAGYAAAFAPFFTDVVPVFGGQLLFSLPFMLVCLLLGVFCGVVLASRTDYTDAVDAATRRDDPLLNLGQMMAEARSSAVKAKESDYTQAALEEVSSAHQHKEGYAYINAIFFSRHRSLIREPFYKRMAIAGGLGAILILVALLNPERAGTLLSVAESLLPGWIIVMSLLTVGEHMCKSLFYHCDLKLLRYSFYRRDAIKHFRIRLGRMLVMNLAIAVLVAIAFTLAAALAGSFITQPVLLMWICVISLSVFFTVHSLLLYYIFQPYTSDLNTKNPLFFLFSWLVSGLTAASFIMQPDPVVFTIVVAAVSLVYLAVSFTLVRKYAPRNFRVK